MRDVTATATNVIDIWPYVAAIPASDAQGHEVVFGEVERVYRSADGAHDHVLAVTTSKNVYIAVIVDLIADQILGHRLLDLNAEYGLTEPK